MLAASRQRQMGQPLTVTRGSCVTQCPLHPSFSEESFHWASTWPGADLRRSCTRRDSAVNRASVCQPRKHRPIDPSPASINSRTGVSRTFVRQSRQSRPIVPRPAPIDSRRAINRASVCHPRQHRPIDPSPTSIDSRREVNRASVSQPRQPRPTDRSPAAIDRRRAITDRL